MPDAENPFTPLPGAAAEPGEPAPALSAGEIAAAAARAAVRGEPASTAAPGSTFETRPLVSEESQHVALEGTEEVVLTPEAQVAAAAALAAATAAPTEPAGAPIAFTIEDFNALQDMGVNLPISPADVPEAFLPIYAELAQSAADSFHSTQQSTLDAQEAILKVQAFTDRLSTNDGQQQMLISMALNNPDVFSKAMETVNRMKEDPEYGESIRRGLEADVKMEAANRKEAAIAATALERKGEQIVSRTVRLAKRLGIDPKVAQDQISHRILQNESNYGKRDISFEEVDQILASFAQRTNTRVPAAIVDPATVAAAAQTPATPGTAPGQTPAPGDPAAAKPLYVGPEGLYPEDKIRNAVAAASSRIKASGL